MDKILSGEKVGSRILVLFLFGIFLVLLTAPFAFELVGVTHSERAMKTAVQIMAFIILAASYDLLIGYAAIISLCHSVFFAIGAYAMAIVMRDSAAGWGNVVVALLIAAFFASILALILALIGIRIKNLYFTLVTFAFAFGAQSFVVKLSEVTGGQDGLTFEKGIPELLTHKTELFGGGEYRVYAYYLIFFISLFLLLFMLRVVSSPFGKTLQAIRENEFRCVAVGYKVNKYKIAVIVLSAVMASVAGVLYSSWVKIAVPNSFLNIEIMLMILIVVMVGGKGSIYGSIVGAAIIVVLENYLNSSLDILFQSNFPEKMQMVLTDPFYILEDYKEVVPIRLFFTKNRWALYIGLFYIFSVYHFRSGIVGKLRETKQIHLKTFNIENLFSWFKKTSLSLFNKSLVIMRVVIVLSSVGQMFTGLWNLEGNNGEYLIISAVLTYLIGSYSIELNAKRAANER